ncbi:MAG: hypothetical protein ABEI31_05910 [Halodesulfurarchaeum sp.]
MGLLDSVKEVVEDAGPPQPDDGAAGAWWCMDCRERVLETEHEGEGTPSCPSCGQPMEWEGSPDGPGCAC